MSTFICSVCGHIEFGDTPDVCPVCEAPAEKFSRNDRVFEESAEKSKEAAIKHIPAITVSKKCGLIPEQSCTDITVRIGATLHPMESAHFIRFIDCYLEKKFISRVHLTPDVFAAGCFHLKTPSARVVIVENCTIHGYWKAEVGI